MEEYPVMAALKCHANNRLLYCPTLKIHVFGKLVQKCFSMHSTRVSVQMLKAKNVLSPSSNSLKDMTQAPMSKLAVPKNRLQCQNHNPETNGRKYENFWDGRTD